MMCRWWGVNIMSEIQNIKAREVLDSRGNPTVEVDVLTSQGIFRANDAQWCKCRAA